MIKIGTKNFFFELSQTNTSQVLIPIRINVSGKYFGTLNSPTYIPSFLSVLESILQSDFYFNSKINSENFKSIIFNKNHLIDSYALTFEETFDDVIVRVIRNNHTIFMYIQRVDKPYFKDSNILLNEQLYLSVSLEEFKEVINELKKYITTYIQLALRDCN